MLVVGSTNTRSFIRSGLLRTAVTESAENPDQEVPVYLAFFLDEGAVSGFPQLHLTTGTPNSLTNTAVPAWRTAGTVVALPLLKPWLVTAVSERSVTGVNTEMYSAMFLVSIPRTFAQAVALSGLASRNAAIFVASHTALFWVPPYRPGVSPGNVSDEFVGTVAGATFATALVVVVGSVGLVGAVWLAGAVLMPSIKGLLVVSLTGSR
ncbi:unannotated protein [freshwater metagenome]|uniref:Unannotated protein n=1 Tax=freshwater metagenome TaxID=449393 RepID=A0A6J6BAN1_9ZZZZ